MDDLKKLDEAMGKFLDQHPEIKKIKTCREKNKYQEEQSIANALSEFADNLMKILLGGGTEK